MSASDNLAYESEASNGNFKVRSNQVSCGY